CPQRGPRLAASQTAGRASLSPMAEDIEQLQESQLGLVTTRQALMAGLTRHQVSGLLRRGAWQDTGHRGVHRAAGTPRTVDATIMAAVLGAGPEAVAARSTAAWLHRMKRLVTTEPSEQVEVCLEDSTTRLLEGVMVHRTVDLPACDRDTVRGIPVTSGARTLIDMAGSVDRVDLTAALDNAICALLTNRSWLHRRARALQRGRPGVGRLVALTAPGAEGVFRSWLERQGAYEFRAAGLPQPEWNVEVRDEHGLIGIVDAVFERRQPVELEGLRFHTLPADRQRDASKYNRVGLAYGRPVLRYTWEDIVRRPPQVVAEIRLALAR
ncbi:MAG: hypothetical protein ACRDQW_11640, partial [Haloechinothrix sp.]